MISLLGFYHVTLVFNVLCEVAGTAGGTESGNLLLGLYKHFCDLDIQYHKK